MPQHYNDAVPVDLFGNPRLTPRQVLQQQLAATLDDTARRTAGLDQRAQGVSLMGAAFGGLLRNALIKTGVLPKPPEMVRAEKTEALDAELDQKAKEQGLSLQDNPEAYFDLAGSLALKANMPDLALKAVQMRELHSAQKRAAERERQALNTDASKEAENLKDFTSESKKAFIEGGRKDPSVLVLDPNAKDKGRGEYFVPVQTADGVVAFDARRGVVLDPATNQPIRRPVVGSASDPDLQRRVSAGKEAGKKVGAEVADLDGKFDALDALHGAQDMLEKGIHAGYWANWKQTAAKATGVGSKEKAANTERFQAHIGNTVIPRLKEFGGNDTVEEMKYLQKVQAGEITMEPKALKSIVADAERKLSRRITRLRQQAAETGLPGREDVPAEAPKPPAGDSDRRARLEAEARRRGLIK